MASTLQLTLAGTVAVHLIAAVVVDAVGVVNKSAPRPPPPRISMVDIDVAALRPTPTPTPEPLPVPEPAPTAPAIAPPPTARTTTTRSRARTAPTATAPLATATSDAPATTETSPSGGGEPIYQLPDLGAGGNGPPIAIGKRQVTGGGRGGDGGGTGTGTGTGDGSGTAPRPLSVAAIKVPAKPIGDFDYFDARKLYPAEARAQGVEGVIKAKLVVDERGKVTSVTLINRLGHGLDELATRRARALEFTPARDADDRAVASVVVWKFSFELPR